jgi:hypothetical protein
MAGGVTMSLTGTDVLVRNCNTARTGMRTITGHAMKSEADAVMADSKENYVPIDTGALRDSGRVEGPEISGSEVSVEMLYGDATVDYAWTVHEDMSTPHKHGGAKFLETPFLMREQGLESRLVGLVGDALEALFG